MARKKTTQKSALTFEAPQSRNEALLQNILGASNDIGEPQSRIESYLQQIVEKEAMQADIPKPTARGLIAKSLQPTTGVITVGWVTLQEFLGGSIDEKMALFSSQNGQHGWTNWEDIYTPIDLIDMSAASATVSQALTALKTLAKANGSAGAVTTMPNTIYEVVKEKINERSISMLAIETNNWTAYFLLAGYNEAGNDIIARFNGVDFDSDGVYDISIYMATSNKVMIRITYTATMSM